MESFVYGGLFAAVAAMAAVLVRRMAPLTPEERGFMAYVHDHAKRIRLSKAEIYDFVSENFPQFQAEFSVNGTPHFEDIPRLKKVIARRYHLA